MKKRLLLLVLLNALPLQTGWAQDKNVFSGTQSFLKRAEEHYKEGSFAQALELYKRVPAEKQSSSLYHKMATCCRLLNNTQEAEYWYKKFAQHHDSLSAEDCLHYAQLLLANGKHEESISWFERYNAQEPKHPLAKNKIEGIAKFSLYKEDSLSYPVKYLSINTSQSEFSPVFYKEGIVFSSARGTEAIVKQHNTKDNSAFLDLYYSKINAKKTLSKPVPLSNRLNSPLHEGPVTFYENESKIIFTRSVNSKEGSGKTSSTLGLFSAEKNKRGKWINCTALPFNSDIHSVAHPSITEDGKTLFFVSDKKGGYGGMDIYVSFRKNSSWSHPVNLGPSVNTAGNECFPYIHSDGVLYFSSNGFAGLGGLDIYKSYGSGENFSTPQNMGYPINSSQDDFGIVFDKEGKSGYFSSNRKNGGTDDDLYSFEVIRILLTAAVRGRLKNNCLPMVKVRLFHNEQEVLVKEGDELGRFSLNLDPGKKYVLEISKENYRPFQQEIISPSSSDTLVFDIALEKEMKSLIKGVVKMNSRAMGHLKVIALEKETLQADTLLSDERGEFSFETDPDHDYLFYVEDQNYFGKVLLKNSRGRKGTFLFYTNIDLQSYNRSVVNGYVKMGSQPAASALVIIQNKLTEAKDSLYTSEDGRFSFEAKDYTDYNISVFSKEKSGSLKNFRPNATKEEEVIIKLGK